MKTLSLTILTAFILNPLFVFAGGSGGGGVLMGMSAKTPEIVFHMGQTDERIKFAYGHLARGTWNIEEIELPKGDLLNSSDVLDALKTSKENKSWVKIKYPNP